MKKFNNGFTLIELIMVTIILGLLAVIAVPRYMTTVDSAEKAAEDEIISNIKDGLATYALDMMTSTGREYWPSNPFDVLLKKPIGYDATDTDNADTDGEWTFNTSTKRITHQRNDNTQWYWTYDAGTNDAPLASGLVEGGGSCNQGGWGGNYVGINLDFYNQNSNLFSIGSKIVFGSYTYYIDAMNIPGNCNAGVALVYIVSDCSATSNGSCDGSPWTWQHGYSWPYISAGTSWTLSGSGSDDNYAVGSGIGERAQL